VLALNQHAEDLAFMVDGTPEIRWHLDEMVIRIAGVRMCIRGERWASAHIGGEGRGETTSRSFRRPDATRGHRSFLAGRKSEAGNPTI
jgi:hypothetical protein